MDDHALETVTCCGLCCLDCHAYNGKIADLARDLRKELRSAHYEKFAEALSALPFARAFEHYQDCYEQLGLMMKFRCKKGCRSGGGPPHCTIRKCCREKGLRGCWECEEYETCPHLDFLNAGHGDAHRKNLSIIKKKGPQEFIKGTRHW